MHRNTTKRIYNLIPLLKNHQVLCEYFLQKGGMGLFSDFPHILKFLNCAKNGKKWNMSLIKNHEKS